MKDGDRQHIATLGGGYGWSELYYSPADDQFYEDLYSCGAIDLAETRFEGRTDLTCEDTLMLLLRECRLWDVRTYRKELHLDEILDSVLCAMEPRASLSDTGWLANECCQYFRFSEDEYAIFFNGTYFSVKKDQPCRVDFSVVRRILEDNASVKYAYWSHADSCWKGSAASES